MKFIKRIKLWFAKRKIKKSGINPDEIYLAVKIQQWLEEHQKK